MSSTRWKYVGTNVNGVAGIAIVYARLRDRGNDPPARMWANAAKAAAERFRVNTFDRIRADLALGTRGLPSEVEAAAEQELAAPLDRCCST